MNTSTLQNLDLTSFYPEEFFDIQQCCVNDSDITILLKAKKKNCECPKCHQVAEHLHGTYKRTVQDLPILGKKVCLTITAHEFTCENEDCQTKTIVDQYNHFIGYYGRFTERCEDFVTTLALETSCEGASRICKHLGIEISGDTIIRILKKRFSQMKVEETNDGIGIDDFSTKKGQSYCTVVCNIDTHKPIAILEGRDGTSLKEWLKRNRHVKTVTRDRASAYAKAINEMLPDAMQIADRFHLHQNLLESIKQCLSSNLSQNIRIEASSEATTTASKCSDNTESGNVKTDMPKKNTM